MNEKKLLLIVVFLSLSIAAALGAATWDMCDWPTDTESYYIPAARKVNFFCPSQMHLTIDTLTVKWLHGKEIFVLAGALLQRILNDQHWLRSFVLVDIMSIAGSSILIFLIIQGYWGRVAGFLCFLLFITSSWTYQYILSAGHAPAGLVFFLLAVFLLKKAYYREEAQRRLYFASGISWGLSLFSSTVSLFYFPYYFVVFLFNIFKQKTLKKKSWLIEGVKNASLILCGFLIIFLYVSYPDIKGNVLGQLDYMKISRNLQQSYYNQAILIQWIQNPGVPQWGGGVWIFKYSWLVMPVLFPVFLFCSVLLLFLSLNIRSFTLAQRVAIWGMVALGWSTPLLNLTAHSVQLGRSFFTFFCGVLILTGFTFYVMSNLESCKKIQSEKKGHIILALGFLIFVNAACNAYLFFGDVFPSRLGLTQVVKKIEKLGIKNIYYHAANRHRENTVECFPEELRDKVQLIPINSIVEPPQDYVLVSPATGFSIYHAGHTSYMDFDKDIFLNELFHKGNIAKYSAASYQMLTSSKIWAHEYEGFSYQIFILNRLIDFNSAKGRVWLLDVKKFKADIAQNLPNEDYVFLVKNGVRNIGTEEMIYMYPGGIVRLDTPQVLSNMSLRIYKVGQPTDGLKIYFYGLSKQGEHIWLPIKPHFVSEEVGAQTLTSNLQAERVEFRFNPPVVLEPNLYRFVLYRTGPASNQNFYRIHDDSSRDSYLGGAAGYIEHLSR